MNEEFQIDSTLLFSLTASIFKGKLIYLFLKKEKEMTSWIIPVPLEQENEESHIGQLFLLTVPTHQHREPSVQNQERNC